MNLEKYLIHDCAPAEEGFIGGVLTGILAMPIILFGSIAIISGRHVAIESRKLHKIIKQNRGIATNYGKQSINIFQFYKNDITGVIEPSEITKYISIYNKALTLSKEIKKLRAGLKNINLYDSKAELAAKKLSTEVKRVTKLFKNFVIPEINMEITNESLVPLSKSTIYKLNELNNEIYNEINMIYPDSILYYIDIDEITKEEDELIDDKLKLADLNFADGELLNAINNFIELINNTTYKCIEACKFAVNKSATKKKIQ